MVSYAYLMKAKIIIDKLGGATKVASIIGVTSQAVSQWTVIPPKHVHELCEALDFKLKPQDVRPDIFK